MWWIYNTAGSQHQQQDPNRTVENFQQFCVWESVQLLDLPYVNYFAVSENVNKGIVSESYLFKMGEEAKFPGEDGRQLRDIQCPTGVEETGGKNGENHKVKYFASMCTVDLRTIF